jgi:hypothetical protein
MALHAGFAAALSTTQEAVQSFIHAAYVNNLIPAIQKGKSGHGADTITFDLVLGEPQITIEDGSGANATAHIELMGSLTFSGPGKPTLSCVVHIAADVSMPVIMKMDKKAGKIQFGLDATQVNVPIGNVLSKRVSGDDPNPLYGVDPNQPSTAWVAILSAVSNNVETFLITPPQLPQFVELGYDVSLKVKNSLHSVNLGIDVAGLTTGNVDNLVDLNRVSTAKGWKKTLYQAVHTSDDEYGAPLYDQQWSATTKRPAGPHNTELAVSLNGVVLADVYLHLGRHAVFAAFEQSKYQGILSRLQALTGKKADTTYEPGSDSLTCIDELDVTLGDGYLQINGVASNYSALAVHASFELKLRFVEASLDGDTQFILSYQSAEGLTAEVFGVHVDQPGWVTAIEVVIGVVGVLLAPFTYGVSFIVMVFLEIVASALVGNLLSGAEQQGGSGVLDAVSGFKGVASFALPGTTTPTLTISPNDIVTTSNALNGWFDLAVADTGASLTIKGTSGDTWPATNIAPIVVVFDPGDALYNPHDPKVRIKWRIYANQVGILIYDSDVEIASSPDPKQVPIDHASNALLQYTKFIVQCRVYRPWDSWTQELFYKELVVKISDRLDRTHPYVHWNHVVHYQGYSAKEGEPDRQALGWQTVERKSHLHYTDPKKRCRFADGFSAGIELSYLDELPFPIGLADQHRNLVCPYCFFGGPDKHVLK